MTMILTENYERHSYVDGSVVGSILGVIGIVDHAPFFGGDVIEVGTTADPPSVVFSTSLHHGVILHGVLADLLGEIG